MTGNLPDDVIRVAARFLILGSIQLERTRAEIHCRVQLLRGSKTFDGESHEIDTPGGRARAAARATLAAAEQAAPGTSLGLEAIAIVDLFSRTYVVASVEAVQNRQSATLAGMVALDPTRALEDAAVLATLRAIDRWVSGGA